MNSKSSNVFLILFFINLLVESIFCYKPSSREYQSSVLVGSKIYYFGGLDDYISLNDAYYFNVDTSEYTAVDDVPVYSYRSSSVVHPKDENICLLIGGYLYDSYYSYNSMNLSQAYRLDTKTSKWSVVETSNPPIHKYGYYDYIGINGVSDDNGNMYFFVNPYYYYSYYNYYYSDFNYTFLKLDINMMSWSHLNFSGDVPGEFYRGFISREDSTVTFLKNGLIIVVGGKINSQYCSMNDLLLFDTNSFKWSTAVAQGANIDGRIDHTAVLTDDRLIIYGGRTYSNSSFSYKEPNPTVAILKIGSSSYEWSIPSSDNNNDTHRSLSGHSATIYEKQMYIAFGVDPITGYAEYDDTVLAFDTDDLSPIDSKKSKSKKKIILGVSLGLIAGLLVIGGIGGYYFWRKRKNGKTNDETITNDDNSNDINNANQDMASIGVNNPGYVDNNNLGYVDNNNNPGYNPGYVDNNNPGYNPGYVDNNNPGYNPGYVDNNNPGYNPGYSNNPNNNPGYSNNPNNNPGYNPGYLNSPNNPPGYVNNPGYISNSEYVSNPGYANNSPGYSSNP
ncbi:hypothetical protein Glove_574g16 [Diversispora epigaea]|uniref:Galactose oxidase n=1 Tax=Diversispora epigaea TaxID=1348612 RepID=A0A397GE65_9GLOM|nr:hypothetical protein Glove_574g16 [Diversispora epigaea]